MPYDKTGPAIGDYVLGCKHESARPQHFFKCDGTTAERSDGEVVAVDWIMCCKRCFDKSKGDPVRIKLQRFFVWMERDPVEFED